MANAARLEQLAGTTNFYVNLIHCAPEDLELAKGFEPPTA
jgi:hypothetical protein